MSADDAVAVQVNKDGYFVAQWYGGEAIPNPETAAPNERYMDMERMLLDKMELASNTEYGFRFLFSEEEHNRVLRRRRLNREWIDNGGQSTFTRRQIKEKADKDLEALKKLHEDYVAFQNDIVYVGTEMSSLIDRFTGFRAEMDKTAEIETS